MAFVFVVSVCADYAREYYATASAAASCAPGQPMGSSTPVQETPLSTVVCALKAYVTWAGVEIVSEARERCGGMVRETTCHTVVVDRALQRCIPLLVATKASLAMPSDVATLSPPSSTTVCSRFPCSYSFCPLPLGTAVHLHAILTRRVSYPSAVFAVSATITRPASQPTRSRAY
jgi:hypothetical protein